MNKYLFKKIEQAHGAYFENLTFVANEVCREKQSETFENFSSLEFSEIAEILGWNKKKETLSLIKSEVEEGTLSHLLLRFGMCGFLAECVMPKHSDFTFDEKGDYRSCRINNGVLIVFWIYSESIGELVEKLEEKANELFLKEIEKSKETVS